MRAPLRKARAGVTLRHWTTEGLLFVGGRERPSPAFADRKAVDGCRLNLLASKLRLTRSIAHDSESR